jgi:sortase A
LVQQGALLGYLEIPSINVYSAVRYGTSTEVLEKDLGLLEENSLPAGGKGCHAAVSGHTGMASKKMLTDLTAVEMGDVFFFHTFGLHLAYEVDNIEVILPTDPRRTELLAIDPEQDLMTLITCTPYGVNSHRLLVRGHRIDYDFSKSADEQGVSKSRHLSDVEIMRYIVAAVSLLLLILMLILTLRGLKKDKEREARKARKAAAAAKEKLKRKG